MCAVSNTGDYIRKNWDDNWNTRYPSIPYPNYPKTYPVTPLPTSDTFTNIELAKFREELSKLKEDVLEIKELLKAAKKFDDATDQHECEMAEKVELIKRVADLVGVDMEEIFSSKK